MQKDHKSYKYPIKMIPAFRNHIWGGNRLITEWEKPCNDKIAAESWELSAHKNGQSIAANGPLKGKTLSEIINEFGMQCLGIHSEIFDYFPLLIKFIDSKQKLSIQVHPDDSYALINEGDYGKTEMWYIVEAQEGSGILCGFKNELTKDQFKEKIQNDALLDELNWIPVKKGDSFFIPPGTVHAICEGTIILEIQQNSDVTYRIYDYNRKDSDGNERLLQIDKALDVSCLKKAAYDGKPEVTCPMQAGVTVSLLAQCKYFTVNEYKLRDRCDFFVGESSFQSLVFVEGTGFIEWHGKKFNFRRGDTFFLPARMGSYTISGITTVIVAEV